MLAFKGIDIARRAARHLQDVRVDFVEYRNAQLMDALSRGEIDTALAYDVEWHPGLSVVPLYEEQMVFVSAIRPNPAPPTVEFRDVIAATLALPEQGDHARTQLQSTARCLGLTPNLVFESSSTAEIKILVTESFADSVMPFGRVSREIFAKELHARTIVNPPLRCTLYLVRADDRPWSEHHETMFDFLGGAMRRIVRRLGALASPLAAIEAPLSQALKHAGQGASRKPHLFDEPVSVKSRPGRSATIAGTPASA